MDKDKPKSKITDEKKKKIELLKRKQIESKKPINK